MALNKIVDRLRAVSGGRRVVYTCLFGHSERFLNLEYDQDGRTDFVCFTDDETLKSDFWTIVRAPKSLLDPHRRSKGFKHRAHLFFPDHAESLYIDNTVRLIAPPSAFFEQLQKSDSPLLMFTHPERTCVYDEAETVKGLAYDDPDLIDKQMNYYRSLGYPKNQGLHATTVLLRRHNDKTLIPLLDDWHSQILRYSKRDQLSFDVVRHFHGLKVQEFAGTLTHSDLIEWPASQIDKRLPRDFDDAIYLELYPDVAAAAVNPRWHFLEHGIAEGRIYRPAQRAPATSVQRIHVDPNDDRGRALLASNNCRLNESTFEMWTILLGETAWTDIVDVGANYGEMLLNAPLPAGARILAFEPNPRILPLLKRNLLEAGIECDCHATAISDHVGKGELYVDTRWSGLSQLKVEEDVALENRLKVPVSVSTLDAVLWNPAKIGNARLLIKIDVEGHEISVLKGAGRVLNECNQFTALIEILHLNAAARGWLLSNFDVELYDLSKRSLVEVQPATPERFETLLSDERFYRNDIVIRRKRDGGKAE